MLWPRLCSTGQEWGRGFVGGTGRTWPAGGEVPTTSEACRVYSSVSLIHFISHPNKRIPLWHTGLIKTNYEFLSVHFSFH